MKKKTFIILTTIVIILGILGIGKVTKEMEEYKQYYPGTAHSLFLFAL